MNNKKLYFITDSSGIEEKEFLRIIEQVCMGKPDLIQLREKNKSFEEVLELSKKVKSITDKFKIPLIIDDMPDIAKLINCGVHLGADDMPIDEARKLLGDDCIIGATAKTVEMAIEAENNGASYLGVGAIYPTSTKVITKITTVDTLNDICNAVNIPVYAIGGLNKNNIHVLENSPIDGICVVSAIMKDSNPYDATIELKNAINDLLNG